MKQKGYTTGTYICRKLRKVSGATMCPTCKNVKTKLFVIIEKIYQNVRNVKIVKIQKIVINSILQHNQKQFLLL